MVRVRRAAADRPVAQRAHGGVSVVSGAAARRRTVAAAPHRRPAPGSGGGKTALAVRQCPVGDSGADPPRRQTGRLHRLRRHACRACLVRRRCPAAENHRGAVHRHAGAAANGRGVARERGTFASCAGKLSRRRLPSEPTDQPIRFLQSSGRESHRLLGQRTDRQRLGLRLGSSPPQRLAGREACVGKRSSRRGNGRHRRIPVQAQGWQLPMALRPVYNRQGRRRTAFVLGGSLPRRHRAQTDGGGAA